MSAMSIANFIGEIILLLVGFILFFGEASEMIAGYNTMSKEEKSKWNDKLMSKFIGGTLTIGAIILIVGGILIQINIFPIVSMVLSWSIFISLIVFLLIYVNTSKRFRNEN